MKKRKPKKSDLIKADKILQKWLLGAGAVKDMSSGSPAYPGNGWAIDCPGFWLETRLGRLWIMPASSHALTCYTCFTCFSEPKRAAEVIGRHNMNDYSGKWNFHYFENDAAPEDFAALVTGEIVAFCRSDLVAVSPAHNIETAGKEMQVMP